MSRCVPFFLLNLGMGDSSIPKTLPVLIFCGFLVHWHVEQTHQYPLSPSKEHSSSKEAEDHDEKIQKSLLWVKAVRGLSRKLSLDLSKTVKACKRFCDAYAINFQNLSESADGRRSFPAIQTTSDELESLKEKLESLAVRCDDFTRDVSLDLF